MRTLGALIITVFTTLISTAATGLPPSLPLLNQTINARLSVGKKILIVVANMDEKYLANKAIPYGYKAIAERQQTLLALYSKNPNVSVLHINTYHHDDRDPKLEEVLKKKYYEYSVSIVEAKDPKDEDEFVEIRSYEEFKQWLGGNYHKFAEEHKVSSVVLMGADEPSDEPGTTMGKLRAVANKLRNAKKPVSEEAPDSEETIEVIVDPSLNIVKSRDYQDIHPDESSAAAPLLEHQKERERYDRARWEQLERYNRDDFTIISKDVAGQCSE